MKGEIVAYTDPGTPCGTSVGSTPVEMSNSFFGEVVQIVLQCFPAFF